MRNTTYDTKDLTLATYLHYNDILLAEPYDKDTQSWIFIDVERCNALSLSLRNKKSVVEPLKWEATRRTLLGMVHDKRK